MPYKSLVGLEMELSSDKALSWAELRRSSSKPFFFVWEKSVVFFSTTEILARNAVRVAPATDCSPFRSSRKTRDFSLIDSEEGSESLLFLRDFSTPTGRRREAQVGMGER